MIPVIVKLCESPGRAGGLPMINYFVAIVQFCNQGSKATNSRLSALQTY